MPLSPEEYQRQEALRFGIVVRRPRPMTKTGFALYILYILSVCAALAYCVPQSYDTRSPCTYAAQVVSGC